MAKEGLGSVFFSILTEQMTRECSYLYLSAGSASQEWARSYPIEVLEVARIRARFSSPGTSIPKIFRLEAQKQAILAQSAPPTVIKETQQAVGAVPLSHISLVPLTRPTGTETAEPGKTDVQRLIAYPSIHRNTYTSTPLEPATASSSRVESAPSMQSKSSSYEVNAYVVATVAQEETNKGKKKIKYSLKPEYTTPPSSSYRIAAAPQQSKPSFFAPLW